MNLELPENKLFSPHYSRGNSWVEHYGALRVAAEYCGSSLKIPYSTKLVWVHGCSLPSYNRFGSDIIGSPPIPRDTLTCVARTDQLNTLRQEGWTRVRALGCPIVYTPKSNVARIPGSLLVMPGHSLVGFELKNRIKMREYALFVSSLRAYFSSIVICVHPSCRANGFWIEEFSEYGFQIVDGANTADSNALKRMRYMFELFESVTSNEWGSGIAYAAAFGAKASIWGEPAFTLSEILRVDEAFKGRPEMLTQLANQGYLEALERDKSCFLRHPAEGLVDREAGSKLVGFLNKVSPDEMFEILSETTDPSPVRGPVFRKRVRPPNARVLFLATEFSRSDSSRCLLNILRFLRYEHGNGLEFDLATLGSAVVPKDFSALSCVFAFEELLQDADRLGTYSVIYSNTCLNGEALATLSNLGIPVITHVHELSAAQDSVSPLELGLAFLHTSHFIACSTSVARSLARRFNITPESITVAYGTLENQVFSEQCLDKVENLSIRNRLGLCEGTKIIVGHGAVGHVTGTDLFLRVANRVADRTKEIIKVHFLWLCDGESKEAIALLELQLQKMQLVESVSFLVDELNRHHAYVKEADIFCSTAREAPFPLAMLEAGACCAPTVCFDGSGGAEEFCRLGGGISVPNQDTDVMAEVIVALLADMTHLERRGAGAKNLVSNQFETRKQAAKISEAINCVLSDHKRPRASSLHEEYRLWNVDQFLHHQFITLFIDSDGKPDEQIAKLNNKERGIIINRMFAAVEKIAPQRISNQRYRNLIAIANDLRGRDLVASDLFRWEAIEIQQELIRSGKCRF